MDDPFAGDDSFASPDSSTQPGSYGNFNVNDPDFEAEIADLTSSHQQSFGEMPAEVATDDAYLSNDDDQPSSPFGSATSPAAVTPASIPKEEEAEEVVDEKELPFLKKFNEEWDEKVRVKAKQEADASTAAQEKAVKDLQSFVSKRKASKDSRHSKNRLEEQAKKEKLAADLSGTNPWERVVSLVDMESSNAKKRAQEIADSRNAKKNGKEAPAPVSKDIKKAVPIDTSRMKQLFIQLKREPVEVSREKALKKHAVA